MRNGNTFGGPGGSRGVDDVGGVLRRRPRQRGAGLGFDGRVVHVDDEEVVIVQPRAQVGGGDHRAGGGVGEHEVHPRRRVRRVDRHVGRPGLEHRQHRDDGVGAAGEHHRHAVARAHAVVGEQMAQPVGRLVELGVGQRGRPERHRHRVGGALHVFGEGLGDRHRGGCGLGQRRTVAPPVDQRGLVAGQQFDRGQRAVRVLGHRGQDLLQPTGQVCDAEAGERLARARGAKEQLVAGAQEEQPEVPHRAVVGVRRRRRGTGQVQRQPGRDEVDPDPVGRLPQPVAFEGVHREALVRQQLADALVDVLAEVGDRRLGRGAEHQRHHAGQHRGQRFGLRTHPPADREVQRHLRSATRPAAHQQRARGGGDRKAADGKLFGQLLDPVGDGRVQLYRRGRRVVVALPFGVGQPVDRPALRRQVLAPVRLVLGIVRGGLVARLQVDQVLHRAEVSVRNRLTGHHCRINGGHPSANKSHAQTVDSYVVAATKQIEFVVPCLEKHEFEHLAVQRHRRALNGRRHLPRLGHRVGVVGQVVKSQLDVRVVDRLLHHLAVDLEERDPAGFGFGDGLGDGLLERVAMDLAVDLDQQTELPLSAGETGFLG